jgi:hypothetical protein
MYDGPGQLQKTDVRTGFANRILLAAFRAPEARTPMAARTIAGLVGLLAAEGADREVAGLLAPVPWGEATFDVLGESAPIPAATESAANGHAPEPVTRHGLEVGRALREASKLASAAPGRVTVVSVGPDGVRRIALDRDPSEPFRFVYPEAHTFQGASAAVRTALERWEALGSEPGPAVERTPPPPAVTPADLSDAVREALGDVMVEVDMVAVEQMVTEALRSALSDNAAGQARTEGPSGWAGQAALVAAADQFHVVLESFNDRVRAGSRSLQSLADELAAQDRTAAAYTDQLAKSVQTSIDRLSRRIDQRFDELQRAAGASRPEPQEPATRE